MRDLKQVAMDGGKGIGGKERKYLGRRPGGKGGLDQERRKWKWREVSGSKEYFGLERS